MKNFALIGAAGYIAPRHMNAILDSGNRLVCATDPSDSVGILDQFFSGVDFFTEFERFDRHIEKLRRQGEAKRIHWVSICSPNYLHDAHIRFALRVGADAICEKPVVLNPWNLNTLQELEEESGRRVFVVLQLRLHPVIQSLHDVMTQKSGRKKHDIVLTYITSRGPWYDFSWKGDIRKSGGIATNIGVHFFDMLLWIFGALEHSEIHLMKLRQAAGYLELENARVKWFLSLQSDDIPQEFREKGASTYRDITIDGDSIEFSDGFSDLHTHFYQNVMNGEGFTLKDTRPSIELVQQIRSNDKISSDKTHKHPFLNHL